jgi:hypothetical protein
MPFPEVSMKETSGNCSSIRFPSDKKMQKLAKEFNLSETAFFCLKSLISSNQMVFPHPGNFSLWSCNFGNSLSNFFSPLPRER